MSLNLDAEVAQTVEDVRHLLLAAGEEGLERVAVRRVVDRAQRIVRRELLPGSARSGRSLQWVLPFRRCRTATMIAPTITPSSAEMPVLVSQPPTPPHCTERVVDVLLEVVDRVVGGRESEVVEAHQEDVSADPEHRGDPDRRER